MIVNVEHIDSSGVLTTLPFSISLPKFLKHGAVAGQGPSALFPSLARGIGLLLYYQNYIQVGPGFALNGFIEPAVTDPTELGDFSTIAGKAFSDILAKAIVQAPFTFTYEAALALAGQPIAGTRPDFYCLSPAGPFSMESKGRKTSTLSPSIIMEATYQAASGSPALAVGFCYASIAYDLYGTPQCLFCDPVRPDAPLNLPLQRALIRSYYDQILRDILGGNQRPVKSIGGREFLTIPFYFNLVHMEFLVDRRIENYRSQNEPILSGFEPIDLEHLYIDRDGIGVSIG